MRMTFTCAECGGVFPARNLSDHTRELAGNATPSVAVLKVKPEDVLCSYCGDDPEEAEVQYETLRVNWNDRLRFENSGVRLDPGQRVFLAMNY